MEHKGRMKEDWRRGANWATVWEWPDDFDTVAPNCERFVRKRWSNATKECSIMVQGHDDLEGTYFEIVAYTGDAKNVGKLAELLFNAALRYKPEFVNLELWEHPHSKDIQFVDDIKTVRSQYKAVMRTLAKKAREDARVKEYLNRNVKLHVYAHAVLFCELRREGVKIKVVASEQELSEVLKVMVNIAKDLKAEVVGYKLHMDVEELEVEDNWSNEVGEVYVFFNRRE
jgi:hypothetical protein